ncbi:MAG: tungsten formylmethanofuran dehydrogenase [Flavobacteriales bacterium]|nr:tungsten formylmethanofuran dehydrogenase [Flavobacteriales bacterium]
MVKINKKTWKRAFEIMSTAKSMAEFYEENFKVVSKYVHATSRGHEAIQIALGLQLEHFDYAYPYYRDDSMLLSIGMQPYDLMLQLLAKKEDPFSGGRTYYAHPSLKDDDKPKIPHQSSATGMQAIPATGAALGMQYKDQMGLETKNKPLVVRSLGDASVTEGEVAEAFQMAALRQLPILYLVQDNEWDISANAEETRAQNAFEYIKGFHGVEAFSINGSDFSESYETVEKAIKIIREERRPVLIHAKVPLLNHHTSGVRMEWYRDDLEEQRTRDPYPVLKAQLLENGFSEKDIVTIEKASRKKVEADYEKASAAEDPSPEDLFTHDYAPTAIQEELGERAPKEGEEVVMVDCALHAVEELMTENKECLLYGQDVGARLGGVFREAATLAQKFGDDRVFNTPIQEAFIVGSTVGMAAVGLKPIVEVQFADYIFPGINQLYTELSRSYYLSNGKYPASMILRVPIGAYGSGGPYHSSSVETIIANIKGIKIAYPSNGADLKGLMKAAYHDPNPVVIFEHKGLYWSKVPGTLAAKTIEPSADYVVPFGKARIVQEAKQECIDSGNSMTVITYGMGVHWALNASKEFDGKIEIVDLRTLNPLDEQTVFDSVKKHNRCLVLTEDAIQNSFARNLAGLIQEQCFTSLEAPVMAMGSESLPAIPLNTILEQTMIPNAEKVAQKMKELLSF